MLMEKLLIVNMIALSFSLYKLAKWDPLGQNPPHLVDNTDILYLWDQHCQLAALLF